MMIAGRRWLPLPLLIALLSGVPAAFAAEEAAQTFKLELKSLSGNELHRFSDGRPLTAEALRGWSSTQNVWAAQGTRRSGETGKTYRSLVKKEPKYAAEFVLNGVVSFGDDTFPFAFDTTDIRKKGFDKLYFDANRNGDLTDDKVVGALKADLTGINFGDNAPERSFPRVGVKIRVGDTELNYAFFVTTRAFAEDAGDGGSKKTWQGYAQFSPAVYREGEVTLAGKKHRVSLLDYNSNGLFNDASSVPTDEDTHKRRKTAYASNGDMLLVDPDPRAPSIGYGYDVMDRLERRHVSKLVWIDNRYWELTVAPAGETITLAPSALPTGKVTNSAGRFHAVVYGDPGLLAIHGSKDTPVVLPEGDWKLLEYTIDLTEPRKAAPKTTAKGKAPKSRLGNVIRSLAGSNRPQLTLVSASATWDYKPVTVTKDKSTPLPFGPPYKPDVSVGYMSGRDTAHLQMDVIGSAGEECSNLLVQGERPENPTFSISTATGEIVERGKFEFG